MLGQGDAFAGLRRKAHSGKAKKAKLQQKRREDRERDAQHDTLDAGGAEAAELKWWQHGLEERDERVLRARLTIARGRKHCQVRIIIHIVAPAVALVTARATATERRTHELGGRYEQISRKLSRSSDSPTSQALALWREAATSAAAFTHLAAAESAEVCAAFGCRQKLFSLTQQACAQCGCS
jgi:hypothetical protein